MRYLKPLSPRWRQRASRIWVDERGGMPEFANVDLDGFRWRDDDGNESSGGASFLAAENINLTDQDADSDVIFRLRILLEQNNVLHDQSETTTPRLDFKLNTGGTYAAVPDSGSGTEVEIVASQLVDEAATTDHGVTKTGGYTFVAGTQEETSASAAVINWPATEQDSVIVEWSFKSLAAGLANLDELFFRVTNAGANLDTYTFGDTGDTNPIKIGFVSTVLGRGPTPVVVNHAPIRASYY